MEKPEEPEKPESPSEEPSQKTTTPTSKTKTTLKIEESKPLDLEPVETGPAGATPPGEAAPEDVTEVPPTPQISNLMVKGVFQTLGKTMEALADDPDMNLDDDQLTLLEEAWAPLVPDMPPWMMAAIATVAVFSQKGMIFAMKLQKKRKAEAEKKGKKGGKPAPETPEKPEETPSGEPTEAKPEEVEKGDVALGPAKV